MNIVHEKVRLWKSPRRQQRGFTLVEMLVAVAVLAVLVVLLAQLLGGVTTVTANSQGRLSADDQARFVLDRIGADLAQMLKRSDINYDLEKNNAGNNDALHFYSEVPGVRQTGATEPSGLALVGYQIRDEKLERVSISQSWDDMKFQEYDSSGNLKNPDFLAQQVAQIPQAQYHILADGVFRMEIGFILNDGTFKEEPWMERPAEDAASTPVGERRWEGHNASICVAYQAGDAVYKPLGWKDVAAVVVTIAVIDPKSAAILDGGDLNRAAGRLVDAPSSGAISTVELPSETWTKAVNQSGSLDIPPKAQGAVRIYQRTFPLSGI